MAEHFQSIPVRYKGYTYQIIGNPETASYYSLINKDDSPKEVPLMEGPKGESPIAVNRQVREAIDKIAAIAEPASAPEPEKKKRSRPAKVKQ